MTPSSRSLRLICLLLSAGPFLLCGSNHAAAQELHVNLRLQSGGSDSDYPGCDGRSFAFLGASVEVGNPLFVELLAESMGAGGADCGTVIRAPDGTFASVIESEPTWRYGVGV